MRYESIERKLLTSKCLKEYFNEDKEILVDADSLEVTCFPYYMYNLIFFGNKILFSQRSIEIMQRYAKKNVKDMQRNIRNTNCRYILEYIEKKGEIWQNCCKVISMEKYGEARLEQVYNFLEAGKNRLYCTANEKVYTLLCERGIAKERIILVEMGKVEVSPFKNRFIKFETIGAIKFQNGKMVIRNKNYQGNVTIKVYNSNGEERKNSEKEVKVNDLVIIKNDKPNINTIGLYEVISKHTRNHALKVIWTDIEKGQNTNKYVKRLPNLYQRLISENCSE